MLWVDSIWLSVYTVVCMKKPDKLLTALAVLLSICPLFNEGGANWLGCLEQMLQFFSTMSRGSKKKQPLLQTRSHWNGDWNNRRMTFRCHPLHPLPLFSLHEWELPNFQDSGVLLIIQWIDRNCIEMSSFSVYLQQHETDRLWHCSLRANHWLQWSCSFNIRLCQLLAARLNTEHAKPELHYMGSFISKALLLPNRHHEEKEVHHCAVAISLLSHFARQRKRVDRN